MSDETKKVPPMKLVELLEVLGSFVKQCNEDGIDFSDFVVKLADKDGELFEAEYIINDTEAKRFTFVRAWTTGEDAVFDKKLAEQIKHIDKLRDEEEKARTEVDKDEDWDDANHDESESDDSDDDWEDDDNQPDLNV